MPNRVLEREPSVGYDLANAPDQAHLAHVVLPDRSPSQQGEKALNNFMQTAMRGIATPGGRIVVAVGIFLVGLGADAAGISGGHDVMMSALVILFILLERRHQAGAVRRATPRPGADQKRQHSRS
jgi:hypothetical protein